MSKQIEVQNSNESTVSEGSFLVEFNGEKYWWIKDSSGSGPLAPLEHCDAEGHVVFEHMFSESFAHIYSNGIINRFGKQIGDVSDLKFLPNPPTI